MSGPDSRQYIFPTRFECKISVFFVAHFPLIFSHNNKSINNKNTNKWLKVDEEIEKLKKMPLLSNELQNKMKKEEQEVVDY